MNEVNNVCWCGDRDLCFEIFVDMLKLIGNSVYGLMIVNKEKYMGIIYCVFKEKVGYFVFKKCFCFLIELDNDYFEIEFVKNCLNLDLFI